MKLMVFDVGGTEIKYSVIEEKTEDPGGGVFGMPFVITNSSSVPTPEDSQEAFFALLERIYRPFAKETDGIALSLPGFIDSKAGKCLGGGALIYNRQKEIAGPLSERCGCPVHIANDAKCAALAEHRMGALKGCTNACTFVIGTGVGGGLILNGEVYNGTHYTAGEFSYIRCCADDWSSLNSLLGVRCSSRFGLLELYHRYFASSEKDDGGDLVQNGLDFFRLYHAGDPVAARALKDFCMETAKQIYNISVLLDLERCAIGGGISRQDVLIDLIRESLDDVIAAGDQDSQQGLSKPEIVRCRFGNEANQIGAFLYFKQDFKQGLRTDLDL